MIRIIGSFVSPYVRKVLACINLKGLAFEVDPITPFYGDDEFERLSPFSRIPVLIDGDVSISNSSVICAYLDDAYPDRPLLPAAPGDRARARWLEEYADTRLGDLFIWGLFYQKVVRPLSGANRPTKTASGDARDRPSRGARLSRRRAACRRLPVRDFGLADIALATFFRNGAYAGFEPDGERWPNTARFVERALAEPASPGSCRSRTSSAAPRSSAAVRRCWTPAPR